MDIMFLNLNLPSSMDKLFALRNTLINNINLTVLVKSEEWNKINKREKLDI